MNRPLHTWLLFAGSLAVLLIGLAWVSWMALRLDHAHAEAQQKANFEEKVRLALWRMDSTLAPLIVQESSRPYFTYNSFYPAERAYNRMFGQLSKGEVLVPSPLLTQSSSNVLIHFQYGPDGKLTSPQVPDESQKLAAKVAFFPDQTQQAKARLTKLRTLIRPIDLARECAAPLPEPTQVAMVDRGPQSRSGQQGQQYAQVDNSYYQQPAQIVQQQAERNTVELQARAQNFRQAAMWNQNGEFSPPSRGVAEGMVKPIWFDNALVLARRVSVEGQSYYQGCWLDWRGIRKSLLQSIEDLLPGADLTPIKGSGTEPQDRLLAALPVKLAVAPPRLQGATAFLTPVRLSLAFAWACVLVAAVAVGGLFYGTVALSERRAAFVSAVTHELRTPLTTFKMYSEMLAAGMVPDESKRRAYLDTLCAEANRLSHLVENVLAYARLERGSARRRIEKITIAELLDRVQSRLHQRAEQAGMQVVVDSDPAALQRAVHVDVSAVEQILFNLVDNACKYAAPSATERLIHLEAFPDTNAVMLRVRDHGQGISAQAARRLFRPFSKSADEAAHSAPGVGLGLALCRRLSRSMGGDLRFDGRVVGGACFVLRLPLTSS